MREQLIEFLTWAVRILNRANGDAYAALWVHFRMELFRRFNRAGEIFSTEHGTEIFSQLLFDLQSPGAYQRRVKEERRAPDAAYANFLKQYA